MANSQVLTTEPFWLAAGVAAKRMLLDQTFFSPFMIGLYFGLISAAEGK